MTENTIPTENGFAAFNLPRALMTSLEHMKYTNPTPVQAQAIPAAMKGKDVLGSAQTGTGKTGAFIIPVLARLMTDMHAAALIMTPTRELATQILTVARQMMHKNETIKTALLIGGESLGRQRAQLSAKPRLIVGTPGRINDHLRDRPNTFQSTNMLILDEADRMLDMGFTPQINAVIKHLPASRQTLMFSATFPKEIIAFTQTYMKDPVRVTIEPERTSAANIVHETLNTTEKTRYEDLMNELYNRKGSIILFIKTKHGADRIATKLDGDGHSVDVIHGGLSQRQRDRAVAGFRNKSTRIMVATDVAARGLDVPHIEHVINYDLPQVAEDYVHRIGRTGRNGAEGRALSFLMPSEKGKWNAIQRILNPDAAKADRGPRRGNGGGFKGGRNRDFGSTDRAFEQDQSYKTSTKAFGDKRPNAFGDKRPARFNRDEPRSFNRDEPRPFKRDDTRGQNETAFEPMQDFDAPRGERAPFKRRDNNAGGFKRDDNRSDNRGNREGGNREGGFKRDFKPRDGNRNDGAPAPFKRRDNTDAPRDGNRSYNDRKPQGDFKRRDNDGFKSGGFKSGGFKGGDQNGNMKRRDEPTGERNFNTEGAGGEDRFRADAPGFDQKQRKPFGKNFGKKKFFNKNKSQGRRSAG